MVLTRLHTLAILVAAFSLSVSPSVSCFAADEESHAAEVHADGEIFADDAEDHQHDQAHAETPFLLKVDPGAALWNLAIFAVVFFVLTKFVWPPILEGLQARESKIHDDLSDAQKAKAEASAMLSDYQTKLNEAQSQVQAMLAEARRDAEATKQQIVDTAKAEADRQRDRAVAEIQSAKTEALSEVANQSSAIALQLARQVVGRELNDKDHADLIRQSLDNMPSNN